jgi:cyanophycinase
VALPDHDATGPLAFTGAEPWHAAPDGDVGSAAASTDGGLHAQLLERAGGEVVLLPTAAAYERPVRLVAAASAYFASLGGRMAVCGVLGRADAEDRSLAELLGEARLIVIADGSPLHLRSVLKDSTALAALLTAWHDGAAVVGWGAGGMVLSDPMVDPRGGAFSVGLGLVRGLAIVPGYDGERNAQLERTLALAPSGCAVVGLPLRAAVLREPEGTWRGEGAEAAGLAVFVDGADEGLAALAGKPVG